MTRHALAGLAALVACLAAAWGCSTDRLQYDPACGLLYTPDFEEDVEHCGGCGVVCHATGAAPACVEGACTATACLPGFIDLDDDVTNGCECRGATPETCTVCLAYDLPRNGRDDDCDGHLDEDPLTREWSDALPLSRAHCGAEGASCLLAPGAEAVECALSWCDTDDYAQGECGHGDGYTICAPVAGTDRYDCATCVQIYPDAGPAAVESQDECFDAVDNDGSGVADDGPYCEVLLANARTTACSGAEPSEACPAYHLAIPTNDPRLPSLEVAFTYDVLVDRYEVTRAQFAAHLQALTRCDERRPVIDPRCHVAPGEALLPAVGMGWQDAMDYCAARGKRLPTYAEYARAALADYAAPGDATDAQGHVTEGVCEVVPAPVIADCGADGVVDVTQRRGDAFVGSRNRPLAWLSATAIHHLTGNVSEWMLDRYVDWCAAARGGHPSLTALVCPASTEPGWAFQRAPLRDLVVHEVQGIYDERLVMGGAFAGPVDAWRLDRPQPASGGASYIGLRCARSLVAAPASDPIPPTLSTR